MSRSTRAQFALALPLLAAVWAVWGLISGRQTLYFRDVFNLHWPAKLAQAEAWRAGYLPLIDPNRAGGQPSLGNPNALPLYPDNLLYLITPDLWAFNAHFWIHLLLAPLSCYWLARRFGLSAAAAWSAGIAYGLSGFMFSQLNFYNLIAGAAIAPALVAATLAAHQELGLAVEAQRAGWNRRGLRLAILGGLWALMLLAGDPIVALVAGVVALAAVSLHPGPGTLAVRSFRARAWALGQLGVAVIAGSLLALPQYLEMTRILGWSYRGFQGFSPLSRLQASWDPRQALDWLVPFPYGMPRLDFWGQAFYGGDLPLFWSLYPGVLVLALVLSSGRPSTPVHRFAWLSIGGGLFFALGAHNPVVGWLLRLPGGDLLRFPIKLWLPVALGTACLAGLGAERAFRGPQPRHLVAALGLLGLLYALLAGVLSGYAMPVLEWLRSVVPTSFPQSFVEGVRVRWLVLSWAGAASCIVYAGGLVAFRRRPALALVAVLSLHALLQVTLLRPLLLVDDAAAYSSPPPWLGKIAAGDRVVQGDFLEAFGKPRVAPYPDPRPLWVQRRGWREGFPFAGARFNLRYELNVSAEGLDSFLAQATLEAMRRLDDEGRLRVLRSLGVDWLILGRELAASATAALPTTRVPADLGDAILYRIEGGADDVQVVSDIRRSPHVTGSLGLILDPGFDPKTAVVLAGDGPAAPGAATSPERGSAVVLAESAERLRVRVVSAGPAALVVQRSHLPIYRATIDGVASPVAIANISRLAVELPGGEHEVEIWVDRRALRFSLGLGWPLALLLIAAVSFYRRRE